MKQAKLKMTVLAVAAALGLAACGGSSTGSDAPTAATSSTVTGVITGFGSVFVDGVEYETDSANFTLDGVSGSESQLAVGMVVTLEGTVNPDGTTGVASSVSFADEVEGVVLSNNIASGATTGSLNIMGQTIRIDADTTLDSNIAAITSFDQIAIGNVVEVSGFSDGNGSVYATRIEVKKESKGADDELSVKGVIGGLDEPAQTFMLGALTIDYSGAVLDGISSLANGLYVEAESDQALTGTTMAATKVELEDGGERDKRGDDGDEMEFEGIIMSVDANTIVVNGQSILVNDRTQYKQGDASGLLVEAKIKVEGRFNADGLLVAEEIKFKSKGDTELTGAVVAVDSDAGTVTLMGIVFHVNNRTIIKDDRDDDEQTPVHYFDLADISVGDWLEVKGFYDRALDQWMATKLEREDKELDDLASIEAIVTDNSQMNQLTMAGISIDFSAIAGFSAAIGDKVEAEGSYDSGVFTASEIEVDD